MQTGDIIAGRYRLESVLGEGGLGVVWAAVELDSSRPVAIKFIKVGGDTNRQRFEIEANALRRLDHPNCIAIYELGQAEGEAFLAMERLTGNTLADFRGSPLSVERLMSFARQLLDALDHAHTAGVAHRDLKPENVFVVAGDTLKVLDFGLAKLSGRLTPDITKTGEVMGTPAYMSPEQLRGTRDAGPPSDIYSLGVMLFELVEGRLPFQGKTMLELGMAHLTEPAPPIRRLDCPPNLRELIAQMLEKEPARRPNARQALAHLDGGGSVKRPRRAATVPAGAARGASSPMWKFAMVAVVAVVAVLVVGYQVRAIDDDPTPAPPAARAPTGIVKGEIEPQAPTVDRAPAEKTGCGIAVEPGMLSGAALVGLSKVEWALRVPAPYDAEKPHRLVILLHPDKNSPRRMMEETKFDELADEHGLILLGLHPSNRASPWRAKDLSDDLANVRTALDDARQRLCVDADQVFAVGHGTGGELASHLRCRPWIAGVALTSYTANVGDLAACETPRPTLTVVPTDTIHIPFDGGPRCRMTNYDAMSIPDYESALATQHGCESGSRTQRTLLDGRCSTSTCAVALETCRIKGGRAWPGTRARLDPLQCDAPSSDFPSLDVVWEFIERTSRRSPGCGSTLSPEKGETLAFDVDRGKRTMWVDAPDGYDPNKPYPLLIALTYGHRTGSNFLSRVGFGDAANDAGYVVIGPDPVNHHLPWRAEDNDLPFLHKALQVAREKLCIDESRIYGFGHAQGAELLRSFAAERPFSAIAITGSALHPDEPAPPATTPTILIAGRDDPFVPLKGGNGCTDETYLSASETQNVYGEALGCDGPSSTWEGIPECAGWSCSGAPLVACTVAGGRYLRESKYQTQPVTGLPFGEEDCEFAEPFGISFEPMVLRFFEQNGVKLAQ